MYHLLYIMQKHLTKKKKKRFLELEGEFLVAFAKL